MEQDVVGEDDVGLLSRDQGMLALIVQVREGRLDPRPQGGLEAQEALRGLLEVPGELQVGEDLLVPVLQEVKPAARAQEAGRAFMS